jgi:hypothetical protein
MSNERVDPRFLSSSLGEKPDMVGPVDVEHICGMVRGCLKYHIAPDWEAKRWKDQLYRVTFQVADTIDGPVKAEEVFSFAPDEIEDAARAATMVTILPMALGDRTIDVRKTTGLPQSVLEKAAAKGLPPDISVHVVTPKLDPARLIEKVVQVGRGSMELVEYYVLLKHGLPIPRAMFANTADEFVTTMQSLVEEKDPASRTHEERTLWRLLIFGFVFQFLGRPPEHDRMTIRSYVMTEGQVAGMEWHPGLTEKEKTEKKRQALRLGAYAIGSSRGDTAPEKDDSVQATPKPHGEAVRTT